MASPPPHSTHSSHRNYYDRYFDPDDDDDNPTPASERRSSNKRPRADDERKEHDPPSSVSRMAGLTRYIRSGLIGGELQLDGPFGARPLLYADWVASGRSLSFLEEYLQRCVLPVYANTHSVSSWTGLQSSLYRREARDIIGRECGASKDDAVLLAGTGSTGAFQLLLAILSSCWRQSELSCARDVCVYVGPYQHHSVLLPLRELGCTILHIREDAERGGVDLPHLTATLALHSSRYAVNLAVFSAASNVSGLTTDDAAVSEVCNRFRCMNVWDYATAAPYVDIDMHPQRLASFDKDAIILSPHKLVGGVSTPGVLIVSKRLLANSTPSVPGGGTVFFVSPHSHRYLQNFEEREEAGTPDIVAAIRAGLVFQLKGSIDSGWRTDRLQRYSQTVMERLRAEGNIVLMGNSDAPRLPIFSFLVRHSGTSLFLHPSFVSQLLNDLFGIQSRSGCMCAGPYAHRCLGLSADVSAQLELALMRRLEILRPGFTRLNAHYVMDERDVNFMCDCISFVARDGWRLLPLYGFHVDSGEWRHRQRLHKRAGRRWLGDIDYSNGSMEYSHADSEQQLSKAALSHADMLGAARQLVDLAARTAGTFALSDDLATLPADVRHLRWFILPSEAAIAIKSPQLTFTQPALVVIDPTAQQQHHSDGPRSAEDTQIVEWGRAPPAGHDAGERHVDRVTAAEEESKEFSTTQPLGAQTNAAPLQSVLSSIVAFEQEERSKRQRKERQPAFPAAAVSLASTTGCNTCPVLSASQTSSSCQPLSSSVPASTASSIVCKHCFHAHWSADKQKQCVSCPCVSFAPLSSTGNVEANGSDHRSSPTSATAASVSSLPSPRAVSALSKKLRSLVGRAILEYSMIRDGDRVLVGVSGGKDSLTLIHILRQLQAKAPIKFELGAVTVDPQTPEYNPRPLQSYFSQLGIAHFYESQPIVATARQCMLGRPKGKGVKVSICSFCSRMKRGMLYSCLRREGWNVLALGQHADDLCESLLMSVMHNGCLRTMKANYTVAAGDLRVIRPLLYVRERMTREFAREAQLPVIFEKSVSAAVSPHSARPTTAAHCCTLASRPLTVCVRVRVRCCSRPLQLSRVLRGAEGATTYEGAAGRSGAAALQHRQLHHDSHETAAGHINCAHQRPPAGQRAACRRRRRGGRRGTTTSALAAGAATDSLTCAWKLTG